MPLVIVFGAYRRFQIDPALPQVDFETITRVANMARRMHMPLAFIRNVPQDRRREPGVWLPGCRPTVADRVFDHPDGAEFRLEGFATAFNGLAEGVIYVAGPSDDSSLRAAIAAPEAQFGLVRRISPNAALHKCSTFCANDLPKVRPQDRWTNEAPLSIDNWERAVCQVQ